MKKTIFICLALLAGCVSGPIPQAYHGEKSVVSFPDVGAEGNAEIGQTMITKANVTKISAISISNDVSEAVNPPGTSTIHAGKLPLFAVGDNGKFYTDPSSTYSLLGSIVKCPQCGIFVPNDRSKAPSIYHFAMGYRFGSKPIPVISETTIEKWNVDSFKRELIYSGISQNTVSILYREFSDNLARPAFSQELKYDLSQGTTIGYKGARFEIIKADNTNIRYKVIKPLD